MELAHVVKSNLLKALLCALLVITLGIGTFMLFEPQISRAVADTSGPFTITQTIVGETSFLVDANNVGMNGSINGIGGGTAYGTTTFAVQSNNANGYYVDISFADADLDGTAMLGITSGSDAIRNYNNTLSVDYNFSTAAANAVFGYSVDSLNPGDTSDSFLSDAAACNDAGGVDELGQCWTGPSTTAPFTIVDRDTGTASATSSVVFRVYVPAGANPVVPADTYIATATLSLYVNP